MKIIFQAEYCTDGDFTFDTKYLDFNPKSSLYNNTVKEYLVQGLCDYNERIYIDMIAEGDEWGCKYALRDLLEDLICSARTIKPSLVRELYDLHNYFLDAYYYKTHSLDGVTRLSGNYDGTYVYVVVVED